MELQSVRRVLTPFELVPFDAEGCAQHYGALRHQLEAAGKPIGSLDTLIAAHAMALGATLVTSDASDFARVPGLRWEDWSS
jgi:tRNA(fMet)-specific endonuclease VapC